VLEATCDVLEAKGAGAWKLLANAGSDPEVERVARATRDRMLEPWVARVAATTGAPTSEARALAHMTSTATRAVIDLWLEGRLGRGQAIDCGTRAVQGLLAAFARPARTGARRAGRVTARRRPSAPR
jgi:hypothetical protein